MLRLLFLLISFSFSPAWGACPLKDGDLIFIKSQTSQAALLKLTTKSEWTHVGMAFKRAQGWDVIEAVQPVQWTTLYSFIRRSRNLHFDVRRATFEFDAKKVRSYAEEQLSLDYDLIFAWDDKRFYCTELVYKAYKSATKEELGRLQAMEELDLSDPRVINEAKKRFLNYGMPFKESEWKKSLVTTPVEMMSSQNLEKVMDQQKIDGLKDCLVK